MPGVELTEAELKARSRRVARLLRPLSSGGKVTCSSVPSPDGQGRVVGGHDGSIAGVPYRDWYFRSSTKDIECQYFEIWRPRLDGLSWFLDRAYFHLVFVNTSLRQRDQIICVHTDPVDAADYKRGPHLHVVNAAEPIPKCHFPLNLSDLNKVLESCESLTKAIESALKIVRIEVITAYRKLLGPR